MEATVQHNEFTKKLKDLLTEFHELNPDLFVNNINIVTGTHPTGNKVCLGIQVEILVQPHHK